MDSFEMVFRRSPISLQWFCRYVEEICPITFWKWSVVLNQVNKEYGIPVLIATIISILSSKNFSYVICLLLTFILFTLKKEAISLSSFLPISSIVIILILKFRHLPKNIGQISKWDKYIQKVSEANFSRIMRNFL